MFSFTRVAGQSGPNQRQIEPMAARVTKFTTYKNEVFDLFE